VDVDNYMDLVKVNHEFFVVASTFNLIIDDLLK
jgi:hypothetical protein